MNRTLLAAWVVAWGVPAGTPPPATAQEAEPPLELKRSVGVSVSPWLLLHLDDGSFCCSGVGVWLQLGRFQIDHAFALNTWRSGVPLGLDGHATTVLWDMKTWRTPRRMIRFHVGAGHHVTYRPELHQPMFHVGLTFDFTVGRRGIVRAGVLGPLPPALRLGAGRRF